jgi:putative membrane protein
MDAYCGVNIVAQALASVAVLFHVLAFVLESVLFSRPGVRSLFRVKAESAAGVRIWALNQGFYNLFLAAGPVLGLVTYHSGDVAVGRALVAYGCAFMVGCALVLVISDRRLWLGAIGQGLPPLAALAALLA